MHADKFLQDLAVVMIAAGLVTIIFHRLKQPVVLGYILAGVIIGSHTPPFGLVNDEHTIALLSELGVVLLMFSLGLEFSLRKLKQVGFSAFIAAFLEILLMVWVGYEIGQFFGWSRMDSLFLGAILSISSTTIIVKALAELGKSRESFAQLIFGILIIEDILAIAMIALLSGIAMTGSLQVGSVAMTLGKLSIFLVSAMVVGFLGVPRLIGYVARFKSNEMLLVTVLGLCFGYSLLAVKLGYSLALGAFLIGAVIAEAREVHRIETLIEPVRDMFSAIFFVAIGLMIDPRMIAQHWKPILVITFAVVAGKVATCSLGAFVGGNDRRQALRVGMGLAQIGEFSFIIATLGLSLKVTSDFLYPIAVAVSVITTLLTPYLIKNSDATVALLERISPKAVVNSLELYTRWVGELGSRRHANLAGKLARRWIAQMLLNAALVAAIFIGAVYVGQHPPAWPAQFGFVGETLDATLWFVATLLSLPLFVATSRKLQALGLLIAETKITTANAGDRAEAIRSVVAQIIPIVGTVTMALLALILSSTLLPGPKVLIVLIVLVGLLAWVMWRSLIRVYARAQAALQETLKPNPPVEHAQHPLPLPLLLREADLEAVPVAQGTFAVKKLIRELKLRTDTGVSIVGIERAGTNLINPGPDEEILAGDQLLLIGTRTQLEAARGILASSPGAG